MFKRLFYFLCCIVLKNITLHYFYTSVFNTKKNIFQKNMALSPKQSSTYLSQVPNSPVPTTGTNRYNNQQELRNFIQLISPLRNPHVGAILLRLLSKIHWRLLYTKLIHTSFIFQCNNSVFKLNNLIFLDVSN